MSSENKGADQLCSYRTADLRLCFRIYADCLYFVLSVSFEDVEYNQQLTTTILEEYYRYGISLGKHAHAICILAVKL